LDNVKPSPHKSKIFTPGIYFGQASEKEKRQEVKKALVPKRLQSLIPDNLPLHVIPDVL